ncbi:hypothetical protein ACA910_009867 [Epithemia clementina (nom. ined.)]
MFYLEHHLRQISGITTISRHEKLDTHGRWNLHTTATTFGHIVKILQGILENWSTSLLREHRLDTGDIPQPARVAFRSGPFEDSSPGGSYETCISACSSLYSLDNDLAHDDTCPPPPVGSTPVTQAWNSTVPVSTIVKTKRTDITPSQLSDEERDQQFRAKNARMSREIHELKVQVRQLVQRPPDIDYNCIVSTVVAAIQQAASTNYQSTPSSAAPSHLTASTGGTTTPYNAQPAPGQSIAQESPNIMDETFVQDQSFCE